MSQQRYAFLIGANGPQTGPLDHLKYAESDVARLAAAYQAQPFAFTGIQLYIAQDRQSTLTQLQQAASHCGPSDLFIVHFSGHGIYRKRLYLVCNNADIENLRATAIEADAVKEIMDECRARHKLLILDCCYSGRAASGVYKGDTDIKVELSKTFEGSACVIVSACSRSEKTRELVMPDGEGAGFLSWVFIAACTSRFGRASTDSHSLSLMDIWRWLSEALQEVNELLVEDERLPRPWLNQQLEAGFDGNIWFTELSENDAKVKQDAKPYERRQILQDLSALHGRTIDDLTTSFVGRAQELDDLHQRIATMQQTGGYVTITAEAGQGKSSIIAKLVEQAKNEHGQDGVTYHFILFDPGPDYQVGLLRNLMASLIRKYNLSDLYIASESRAALRDYFPVVLKQVADQGRQEFIYIDGLDQLEADASGIRDLTFLPEEPPEGIVFVLGTRPDDTLEPLELRKPHERYRLPNLSRPDFALLMQHRGVSLDSGMIDRLYQILQGNALYLDLAASALTGREGITPGELVKQLADDPNNIFSVALRRLKRESVEWREVLKPILGVLLLTREPLSVRQLRDIINIDTSKDHLVEVDRLNDGLQRLGGLVARDSHYRYTLFHLKLYDYLRQDESEPARAYVFATDEEERLHERLVAWCAGDDIAVIWSNIPRDQGEQERRSYARQHYITHLYHTRSWQRLSHNQEHPTLFAVLDAGEYGRFKLRFDPSTRSYAQDLDLGREAASWQGWTVEESIDLLPRLWQYTLLRCSLASRADNYPDSAFELLILLNRKQQALNLAELLTDPARKVHILLQIAEQLRKSDHLSEEYDELLLRAEQVIARIEDDGVQAKELRDLSRTLTQAGRWEQAEQVITRIMDDADQRQALSDLSRALAQAGLWEQAEQVITRIKDDWRQAGLLSDLSRALAQAGLWEQAEQVIARIKDDWMQAGAARPESGNGAGRSLGAGRAGDCSYQG